MNRDLAIIKKKYGEKMMHLCRDMFATLLEQPGLLSKLFLTNFEPNKHLYDDIIANYLEEDFENYIYSLVDVEQNNKIKKNKSPYQLLEEVGYTLYECKTEEDIQKFKKYYANGEELCTFNGGRLDRCYVFFAVKKNVEEIKRENFNFPKRQDEYGTSVISIQFSKGKRNTLSIKNRYNHRVNNPDATFSNNLDNIMEGLTESFENYYKLNLKNSKRFFELPGYVKANDGKFYKYNYERNNIYYCPNNIIIDNFEVIRTYTEKEKYIVADRFIIDLVNKKIIKYDSWGEESFLEGLKNIEKIRVTKSGKSKEIEIQCYNNKYTIIITLDDNNEIIGYSNENIEEIGDNFLSYNLSMANINLTNVKKIGKNFLGQNWDLKKISFPNLIEVSDNFISLNREIETVNLPKIKKIGNYFLYSNQKLKEIKLPNLKKVKNGFIMDNEIIENIDLPSLEVTGSNFLRSNKKIKKLRLEKLEYAGYDFLRMNKAIEELYLPNIKKVSEDFLLMMKINNKPQIKGKITEAKTIKQNMVKEIEKTIKNQEYNIKEKTNKDSYNKKR